MRSTKADDLTWLANHPAPGKAGVGSLLTIGRYCPGLPEPGRWPSRLVYMRVWILISVVSALLLGCATSKDPIGAQGVDIAVNLGFERERELDQIQSALLSAGIPCNQRAMSCNEAPLVVRPGDFERARAIATETVIRNSLTVRLFKSPSGLSSLLEVWEDGRKIREEPHKLYPLSDDTIKSINAWNSTRKDQTK